MELTAKNETAKKPGPFAGMFTPDTSEKLARRRAEYERSLADFDYAIDYGVLSSTAINFAFDDNGMLRVTERPNLLWSRANLRDEARAAKKLINSRTGSGKTKAAKVMSGDLRLRDVLRTLHQYDYYGLANVERSELLGLPDSQRWKGMATCDGLHDSSLTVRAAAASKLRDWRMDCASKKRVLVDSVRRNNDRKQTRGQAKQKGAKAAHSGGTKAASGGDAGGDPGGDPAPAPAEAARLIFLLGLSFFAARAAFPKVKKAKDRLTKRQFVFLFALDHLAVAADEAATQPSFIEVDTKLAAELRDELDQFGLHYCRLSGDKADKQPVYELLALLDAQRDELPEFGPDDVSRELRNAPFGTGLRKIESADTDDEKQRRYSYNREAVSRELTPEENAIDDHEMSLHEQRYQIVAQRVEDRAAASRKNRVREYFRRLRAEAAGAEAADPADQYDGENQTFRSAMRREIRIVMQMLVTERHPLFVEDEEGVAA